jgi:hypothetical protein
MKRPEVTVENYQAVESFFADHGPNRRFMQGFHGIMGALFHPEVAYLPGSHDAVDEHLSAGKAAVFSLAHVSWFDPCNYAAVIDHEPILKPAVGNVTTAANGPLFNARFLGWVITTGGASPALRDKDVDKNHPNALALKSHINSSFLRIATTTLDNKRNVAIFPESTRGAGRPNRKQLLPFKPGVLKMVQAVQHSEDVLIIMMSAYYGDRKLKRIETPAVGIGHLAVDNLVSLELEDIRRQQQRTLDLAVQTFNDSLWRV